MANPSPNMSGMAPPFQKGQSGNPGGKTAEQRRAEVEAAEIAASIRLAALRKLSERIANGEVDADAVVTSDNLRLFKDSEDRAHGTPKQTVHGAGEDGEHLLKASADDAFATFLAAMGRNASSPASGADAHGDVEGDGAA